MYTQMTNFILKVLNQDITTVSFEISSPFTQKDHIQICIFLLQIFITVQQNDTSKKVSATYVWSILINKKKTKLAVIAEIQEEPGKLSVFLFAYLMVETQLWF